MQDRTRLAVFSVLAVTIIAALSFAGYYYFVILPAAQHPGKPETAQLPTPAGPVNFRTYSNSVYGFSFNYPEMFTEVADTSNYIPAYGLANPIEIVSEPGFADSTAQYSQQADFAVSFSSDTVNCFIGDNGELSAVTTINGTQYRYGPFGGAAAGHSASGTVYRTTKGNNCFEVRLTIETQTGSGEGLSNLQSKINSNRNQLTVDLNQILSSFKFTLTQK